MVESFSSQDWNSGSEEKSLELLDMEEGERIKGSIP